MIRRKMKPRSSNYEAIVDTTEAPKLCTYQELPNWAKDNQYIVTGYRIPCPSYRNCIKTLTYIHNETGNIISHLFGALLFIGIFINFINQLISSHLSNAKFSDYFWVILYCLSAIFCFIASSMFHTFSCHSEKVNPK